VVINATGIFSDAIRRMDNALGPSTIQPSQGVHLVFDRSFLQGDSAIMVPHTDDGRVLFVIPWHGKVLVGTTDTPMETPEIEPRALPDEIGFILRNAARYLARDPQEKDILSVFAGQRPLVRPPGNDGAPTKNISRNHEIFVSDSGLITVTGGKWTTYRKMAQDTMDKAIMLAGLKDHACVTTHLPLLGWQSPDALPYGDWLSVYGSEIPEIQSLILADPSLAQPIHPLVPYPMATVVWAARHEQARTLEDVLSRRTRILLLNAQAAMEAAPAVANLLSKELGHDENWTQQQIATFTQLARGYLHHS
jgi:glycerol-3-phosphate dehydrogenase